MSNETILAVVALIVSLIALFISLVQLLQQVFGTADGYRKCQESVIGPWSKYTKLSRRWKEFRLETMYRTPEITLVEIPDEPLSSTEKLDEGTGLLCQLTSTFDLKPKDRTPDKVTWILFLEQMYNQEQKARSVYTGFSQSSHFISNSTRQTVIKIEGKNRSWDLVSPEIVKPLASITLGHLIVLAHRLGMRWRDLRVSEGFMLAEGKGHSLMSTLMKGVGPVFQYTFHQKNLPSMPGRRTTAPGKFTGREALIPHRPVDMMACGIIPYCQQIQQMGLDRANLTGANSRETRGLIISALLDLGVAKDDVLYMTTFDRLTKVRDDPLNTATSFVFGDWIGLTVEFLPRVNSVVTEIISPYYTRKMASSFMFGRCRRTYRNRLRQYINTSGKQCEVLKKTLDYLECFDKNYSDDFHCRWQKSLVKLSTDSSKEGLDKKNIFIEFLRQAHDFTTEELSKAHEFSTEHSEKASVEIDLRSLVAVHLSVVSRAYSKALEAEPQIDTQASQFFIRQKTAQLCVESLPTIVASFKPGDRELEPSECDMIERCWWLLVLRGISWYMSVWITESDYFVPYHFYDSQSYVWIT